MVATGGWEDSGEVIPSGLGRRLVIQRVNVMSLHTEFFKMLSQKLSVLGANLREFLHVGYVDCI
jgi:hypothetical protein